MTAGYKLGILKAPTSSAESTFGTGPFIMNFVAGSLKMICICVKDEVGPPNQPFDFILGTFGRAEYTPR